MTWEVEHVSATPAAFHARNAAVPSRRAVWICAPTEPAVVLGSTQSLDDVDPVACRRAGVDIVPRRSGGGAVLVSPGALVWTDVVLPVGDELWELDVGRASHWLGEVWRRALADLGVEATVHHGGLVQTRWSRKVCFAGLGPGELTVDGTKVVGLAQRRTRAAARFQCAALLEWQPDALVDLLALAPVEVGAARSDLARAAAGLGVGEEALVASFLRHLP